MKMKLTNQNSGPYFYLTFGELKHGNTKQPIALHFMGGMNLYLYCGAYTCIYLLIHTCMHMKA